MDSLQSALYSGVTDALGGASGYYASMLQGIGYAASSCVLRNADELTGNRVQRSAVDGLLEANRQYRGSVDRAESIIQSTDFAAREIQERLEAMESLAENAASGQYSADEVAGFQAEFELLMAEIDDIAIHTHPYGQSMLLSTSSEKVTVDVGVEQTIAIGSMAMTAGSLGITGSMDLVNDPAGALATVRQATADVGDYRGHLANRETLLADAAEVLQAEWTQLKSSRVQVDSSVSAWQALSSMLGMMEENAALTLVIQANATADEALKYLLENA